MLTVAAEHQRIVRDLRARLKKHAGVMKPAMWIKFRPEFLGVHSKSMLDTGFEVDDGGLPVEKPAMPAGVSP
jgi:hypothetical protein